MRTKARKFPYDITSVTKDNWRAEIDRVSKYCRMDSVALHEIFLSYVKERAQTYFNNVAFPKLLFPPTASQAALDILRTCFIPQDLYKFPESIEAERLSYFGGATMVFMTEVHTGASFDSNSCYPAAMCNMMPVTMDGVVNYGVRGV